MNLERLLSSSRMVADDIETKSYICKDTNFG